MLVRRGVYLLLHRAMFNPPGQSKHRNGGDNCESEKKHMVYAQVAEHSGSAPPQQVERVEPRRHRDGGICHFHRGHHGLRSSCLYGPNGTGLISSTAKKPSCAAPVLHPSRPVAPANLQMIQRAPRSPLMIVPAGGRAAADDAALAHGWVVCGIERVASEALAVENLGRRGGNLWHQMWSGYKFCAAYVERV